MPFLASRVFVCVFFLYFLFHIWSSRTACGMQHPHCLNRALWGQFCATRMQQQAGQSVCVSVCVCFMWAALTKLASLQSGQILGCQRAAKDAKTQPTENKNKKPLKLYLLFLLLFLKSASEVWGQMGPLTKNLPVKGKDPLPRELAGIKAGIARECGHSPALCLALCLIWGWGE